MNCIWIIVEYIVEDVNLMLHIKNYKKIFTCVVSVFMYIRQYHDYAIDTNLLDYKDLSARNAAMCITK